MDRLLRMDKERFVEEMLLEVRAALGKVADAVNDAPDGKVINASEMPVRDVMVELQRRAFEKAVQMRLDATEASVSPSEGPGRPGHAQQGPLATQHAERQRPHRAAASPVAGARRGER